MLGKLGIGITDQQTLTLTTPDHKLIELNTDKGRVYAPSELKNQSLYLVAPKTSRTFLNGETVNLPRGDRYASFFANGKLLLGQVLGAGMEKTPSNCRGNFPKYLVCYRFLTPERKLVVGEHDDLNEKQYRDRPAPGTAVAVLLVNPPEDEILYAGWVGGFIVQKKKSTVQ